MAILEYIVIAVLSIVIASFLADGVLKILGLNDEETP